MTSPAALGNLVSLLAAEPDLGHGGDPWPVFPSPDRGPGFYFSLFKLAAIVAVFLLWVRTTAWVNHDALRLKLNHRLWNPLVVFTFLAALALFWLLPSFWIGLPLLCLAWLGPVVGYGLHRNPRAPMDDQVFTGDHFRYLLATRLRTLGIKLDAEKSDPRDAGLPLELVPLTLPERDARAAQLAVKRSSGFVAAKKLLAELPQRRVTATLLELTADELRVGLQVDGLWHARESESLAEGTALWNVLQTVAGIPDGADAQKSFGRFAVEAPGVARREFHVTITAGPQSRRMSLRPAGERDTFPSLAALGMSAEMEAKILDLVGGTTGLVLFAGLPANGVSTTLATALDNTDRYLREFAALEDARHAEYAVENIPVAKYNLSAAETPLRVLDAVLRKYPNVLVAANLPDGETAERLCQQAAQDRLVVATIAAKDAPEALARVLALKTSPAALAKAITAVVGQRLIRKLCPACKQLYLPTDEVLQQLGLSGKVSQLFRPTVGPQFNPQKPKAPPVVCPQCDGIGYRGRTGLFELLLVDDTTRQVIAEQPKLDLLRAAAKKAGLKPLQDQGVKQVAQGTTSVDELVRVLKQ